MVKHLVFWRLTPTAHGNDKATNARLIKQKLEALRGRIPGLEAIEVGLDFGATPNSSDVSLYTEFSSRAALDAYQTHPEHLAVVAFVKDAVAERRMVDYEV